MHEKTCRICGEHKPVVDFSRRSDAPDGYRTDCKVCVVRRTSGRDRVAYNRQYRRENDEALRGYARRHPAHPDGAAYFRTYRAANLATMHETERRYRARNRDKEAVRRHSRRALPMDDLARDYIRILHDDPCSYCGRPGGTVDHIAPVTRGGTNCWTNLTSACLSCNSRKRTRSLLDYLLVALTH